jgi:hypothetical protein
LSFLQAHIDHEKSVVWKQILIPYLLQRPTSSRSNTNNNNNNSSNKDSNNNSKAKGEDKDKDKDKTKLEQLLREYTLKGIPIDLRVLVWSLALDVEGVKKQKNYK